MERGNLLFYYYDFNLEFKEKKLDVDPCFAE